MSVGAVNKQTGDRIPTAGMPAIDDALDLTSVNPVQNAIVTAALALKQDKTDNNLQTTDKTVVGAVNELKSGLINVQNDVKLNTQDLTTGSRTKNILPLSIDFIKANNTEGTWNGNVYTVNGITITFNTDSDGNITSITKSADTPSATTALLLYKSLSTFLPSDTTKINGCPNGGSATTHKLDVIDYNATVYAVDYGRSTDGATISNTSSAYNLMVRIIIYTGSTTEITFYPMIRLATASVTFAPYIPSVDARLEAVESGCVKVVATTNLNECTELGIYTYLYTAQNVPSQHSGSVLVLSNTTAFGGVQIARGNQDNNVYVRFFDDGVFTQWQSMTLGS